MHKEKGITTQIIVVTTLLFIVYIFLLGMLHTSTTSSSSSSSSLSSSSQPSPPLRSSFSSSLSPSASSSRHSSSSIKRTNQTYMHIGTYLHTYVHACIYTKQFAKPSRHHDTTENQNRLSSFLAPPNDFPSRKMLAFIVGTLLGIHTHIQPVKPFCLFVVVHTLFYQQHRKISLYMTKQP